MNELMSIQIPLWVCGLYIVYMCAVQALPRPFENDNRFYVFFYGFAHLLCWNLQLFFDPTKKLKTEMIGTVTEEFMAKKTTTATPPVFVAETKTEPLSEAQDKGVL